MLVMAKDSGLLFGIVIGVAALYLSYKDNKKIDVNKIAIVISVLLGKVLWTINLKLNNVTGNFNGKYDLVSLIKVLLKKEESYRGTVLRNYIENLLMTYVKIGDYEIAVNYLVMMFFVIVVIVAIFAFVKEDKLKEYNVKVTNISAIVTVLIYIVGICLTYMYKFSEEEAIGLASFERYIRVVYLAMYLFINYQILILFEGKYKTLIASILMLLAISSVQMENVYNFVSGAYKNASINVRNNGFEDIRDTSLTYVDGSNKIWYINQGETSDEHLVYRFLLRPNVVDGFYEIGENDDYLYEVSALDWINELIDEEYDFVAIHHLDGEFVESYQSIFKDEISDNAIYRVNKQTKMLEMCD